MDELEQLNYDTSKPISDEEASALADQREEYTEYRKQEEAQRLSEQNAAQADQNQRNAEIDDSRNKENWGAGEYTKEVFSAIGGGLQDTASSLVTLPERIIDMATGEMAREAKTKEGYKPEWDDFFVDDSNPIETKTWWGGLIRGLTHYTSLAAVPVPGFGVGAKLGAGTTKAVTKIVPKLAANKKAMGLAVKFGKEARRGMKVDLLSRYSQDDNALGVLDQHFPGVGGPLATQRHDHPMVKTFKNVVEGMGLGIISDSVLEGMQVGFKLGGGKVSEAFKSSRNLQELEKGRALLKGGEKTAARIAEIEKQLGANPNKPALDKAKANLDEAVENLSFVSRSGNKKARARAQLDLDKAENRYEVAFRNHDRWSPEGTDKEALVDELTELRKQRDVSAESYDPHKNEPREVHQGNATSIENVDDVLETAQIIRTEWGANKGSLGGLFSKQAITNMMESADMGWKELDKYAKAIENSPKIKADIQQYRAAGRSPQDYYNDNLMLFDQMVRGRETTEMSVGEFLKPLRDQGLIQTKKIGKTGIVEYMDEAHVKALDLVTGDLLRRLRDTGIMSRELEDILNVDAIGGPTQAMIEQLIAVTKLSKMSRMLWGQSGIGLKGKGGKMMTAKQLNAAVDAAAEENIKALQLATKLAGDGDDELLNGIRNYISQSDNIQNVDDLMAFLRKKMRGGELNGSVKTGALIRELGMVLTNSVLSGPKTPVRAVMGTSSATFMRPMSQALGAAMTGDGKIFRESLADINGMIQAIPESFTLFKKKLDGYWSGDLANVRTRFVEKNAADDSWKAMSYMMEKEGTVADKGIFYLANMARSMNDNNFLTYSTKVMAATDDAFGYILGRGRLRAKAFREVMSEVGDGNYVDITPEMIAKAENKLVDKIFDAEGNLTDNYILAAKKEATLTQDLNGFAEGLNNVFQKTPWAKPFFLFARTGVNGLNLTAKHTPGFNFLVKEWNDINFATPDNLSKVAKYGIETAEDLANAKALQYGRLAMGSAVIFMAGQKFLGGGLHGNGPADRQKRQTWIDAGWKPRTIKIGDTWVSYDAFEPFNQILAIIGDIGDHQELMGEEWAEDHLQKLAVVVAQGITSKSYLAGMQQFVDLMAGQPGQSNRIIASLMNNTIPLSSLRNELGKIFNPYTKELGSDIGSSIRNRNLITEGLASEALPTKYDMLTGAPIKDHDFITRMFNSISPVQLNMDYSPGKQLLFNSGYDLRQSTYYAPDGTNLTDSPVLRSMFQKAMGDQRILIELDRMAEDEGVQRSVALMDYHRRNGNRDIDPKTYVHNVKIRKLFERAKKRAWAQVKQDQRAQKLIQEARDYKVRTVEARRESINQLINIPK
tara:strand:- start:68 stop:4102 length:4035 start_codon:yes stop_codon:yes gene_type:complete